MRRSMIQSVALLGVILALGPKAGAVEFAGGTGEPRDPYQIATAEQLIAIGQDPNLADKHYVLVADINLDPSLSLDYAFDGPVIEEFGGTLDGQGFCIRHLTVKGATGNSNYQAGLCGHITKYGEIRSLVLEDVEVSFAGEVGGICGSSLGRIIDCSASGTVLGEYEVGVLVGSNGGFVYRCHAEGTASSASGYAGGLAGNNTGQIGESSSFCTVAAHYDSGGLVGHNYYMGQVWDCYALGAVAGETAGGLVAGQDGVVHRCYAACQIEGGEGPAGGLVGEMGGSSGRAETRQSYFLLGPDNGIGTPLTGDQMRDPAGFDGWDFWGLGNDGFNIAWFMPQGGPPELTWSALASIPDVRGLSLEAAYAVIQYARVSDAAGIVLDYDPVIPWGKVIGLRPRSETPPGALVDVVVSLGTYDWSADSEAGTPNDPYGIVTAGQLDCLACEPALWNKSSVLLADLDMAWRTSPESLIGQADPEGVAFEGSFDGQGHIIENLTFVSGAFGDDDAVALGLFGRIGPSGSVYDLGLRGVSIGGRRYDRAVGGMLCAINEGSIARCYAQGTVNWYGRFGGLVGRNAGIIADCYTQGEVDDLGGRLDSRPDGGLVGENTTGTIQTCYSTCVISSRYGGGLVGENTDGLIIDSLWDKESSGLTYGNDWGIGLSTIEMHQQASFAGWDFEGVWSICEEVDYPRLRWEEVSCEP